MENTTDQTNAGIGKALFRLKCKTARDSKSETYYVVASSLEAAIRTFRDRWNSHIIVKTSLVASDPMMSLSPSRNALLLER